MNQNPGHKGWWQRVLVQRCCRVRADNRRRRYEISGWPTMTRVLIRTVVRSRW
jgi:hypothetical protein